MHSLHVWCLLLLVCSDVYGSIPAIPTLIWLRFACVVLNSGHSSMSGRGTAGLQKLSEIYPNTKRMKRKIHVTEWKQKHHGHEKNENAIRTRTDYFWMQLGVLSNLIGSPRILPSCWACLQKYVNFYFGFVHDLDNLGFFALFQRELVLWTWIRIL